MATSNPIILRKAAPYLAIVLACLGLAWCSFSTDDTAPVEMLPRTTASPQSGASATTYQQTAQVDPLPADMDLRGEVKDMQARGKLPKIDVSKDIKGADQNLNGVRDDMEAWIAAQPMTDQQKSSAMLKAAAFQKTLLVDLNDKVALQKLEDELMLATKCLGDAYNPNRDESYKISKQMEAMNTSTKDRLIRYMQYNAALSGMSFRSPTKYTCP
ncbi:MAG TPA: hypothetical protein PKC80_03210 [Burkholderiaceae bacterium]|nr:hypothetical protein [Burkholderiaceae bacterium]